MNNLTQEKLDTIFKDGKNISGKPIYIDFYADWWGPCKQFEQVLDNVIPKYEDNIQMYKVNIEDEPQIAQNFGVRSIPFTVMISKSGEKESQTGSMTPDQLKYYFNGLIQKK